jgi:hypothetical protein
LPQQPVIEDIDFLKMITQGHASAYKIHAAMKEQAAVDEKQPIISYSNIAERMLRLARDGLIEETEINGKRSIHGRKDYKLTAKGIHVLVPDTERMNMQDMKALVNYLSKDKTVEGDKQLLTVYHDFIGGFLDMKFLLEDYSKYLDRPKLMPLKYALTKDMASIEFREIKKLSKSKSSEQLVKPVLEIIKKKASQTLT